MAFIPRVIEKFLDMINLQRHNDNYADIATELDKSDAHIGNTAIHTTQAEKNKLAGIQAGAQVNTVNSVAGRTGNVVIGWEDVGSKPSSSPANIDDAVAKRHDHSNKAVLDATTASFISAEKTKLEGIATGAQVNQNAYSSINGISAQNPTDSLEIVGDIGLTVTTDPANKKVTLTVTGEAAPGAHATTHLPGGSDPIPAATLSTGGLMSAQDKQDLAAAKTAIAEGQTIPAPISRGVNVIQSDQASGATFNVRGCTLCNLLGRRGNGASATPFTLSSAGLSVDTTTYLTGDSSLRMVNSVGADGFAWINNPPVDPTKYYIAVARVKNGNLTRGIRLRWYNATAAASQTAGAWYAGTDWQTIYIKMQPSNIGAENYLMIDTGGAKDQYAHIDSLALFESSAVDYAAIDTSIVGGKAVDSRWPYVDSVQHTRGLSVLMPGKNLLKGVPDTLHANVILNAPYDLLLNGTGASPMTINSKGSTMYTIVSDITSSTGTGYINYYSINADGVQTYIGEISSGVFQRTFTTPADCVRLRFNIGSTTAGGVYTFKNWMLVLGGADQLPANFMPYNPSYAHTDTILASNVDRSIADSYDSATGQVFRRWKTGVKTEASFTWIVQNYAGFKRISATNFLTANSFLNEPQTLYNYSGKVLVRNSSADTVDSFHTQTSNGALHICISNNESGWTEAINPSANAIKALTNGWRANGNNGSVYNSWVSVLDGSPPPTNTEAYVAANKVTPGFAYATLDYVRATPITEQLTGDLGGLSIAKGGNQVELMAGVVVREKVTPVLTGGLYYINDTNLPVSKLDYRAERVLAVYKGAEIDHLWRLQFGAGNSYGSGKAIIAAADYDPAAEYFVDYIVMDKHTYTANAVDATLVYRSTLGGAVAQATQDIAKLQQHNGVQDFALDYIEAKADNNAHDLVQRNGYGTTAGTATAYMLTLTPAPQLVEGMRVMVKLHVDNGANPTLNVNGTAAQAIRKPNGSTPAAGLLKSGSVYTLVYNGAAFILQGEGGEYGTAVASEVLLGKTIGTDAGLVTGTIPHYKGHTEAAYVEPNPGGTRLFMMPYIGYYDAGFNNTWVYRDDPNFIASNIRKNSNIFGLAGTLQPYDLVEPGDYQLAIVNQTEVERASVTLFPTGSPIYVNVPGTYRVSFTLRASTSSATWGRLWWTANGAGNSGFIGQEYMVPEGINSQTFTQDIFLNPTGYTGYCIYIALRGVSESYRVYSSNLTFKCAVKPYVSLMPV